MEGWGDTLDEGGSRIGRGIAREYLWLEPSGQSVVLSFHVPQVGSVRFLEKMWVYSTARNTDSSTTLWIWSGYHYRALRSAPDR